MDAGPWGPSCLQCGVKIRRFPNGGSVSAWLVLAEGARPRKGVNSSPPCGCVSSPEGGQGGPRAPAELCAGEGGPRAGGPGGLAQCCRDTRAGSQERCLGSEGPEPAVGRQQTPLPSSRGWLGSYVLGGLGTEQVPGSRMSNEGQDRQL